MGYKFRRSAFYSQNFLRDPELVKKLIRNSSIGKSDTVIEIGAGKVIAEEKDRNLYKRLKNRFVHLNNLELVNMDFLNYKLPSYPHRVFANVPFIITAQVIRKLTEDNYFQEGYLVVQKEFAKKIIGKPYDNKNSMMATLLKPWFEISVFHEFLRSDFIPRPHVDSTMTRLRRRLFINRLKYPQIEINKIDFYRNFIIYIFNKKRVSRKSFDEILWMFDECLKRNNTKEIMTINREANMVLDKQKLIQKIHRTRKDKNWRLF